MAFISGIQCRDLSGQVVVPRPGGELVDAHRHIPPKPFHVVRRSGRRHGYPAMHRGVSHIGSEIWAEVRETGLWGRW